MEQETIKEKVKKWGSMKFLPFELPGYIMNYIDMPINFGKMVEELYGNVQSKKILDVGCGYFPQTATATIHLASKGAIVYGLDKVLKYREHKSELRKHKIIPVAADATEIGKIFKNARFDGIISRAFLGFPFECSFGFGKNNRAATEDFFRTCYSLTKDNSYNIHYKFNEENFSLEEKDLENMGFEVLNFFEEKRNPCGSVLILRKNL
ncbi:hypothetical protein COS75_02610 [Candidatus Pacearchaeota archaeon CG06_land_8_20_14_3_00_35_12]|nr:MAG: hypothetical protein COS75_02610 [Candidatus Pacearchaeota archaeon CG06_land_8_20_14_3_00_35_12]